MAGPRSDQIASAHEKELAKLRRATGGHLLRNIVIGFVGALLAGLLLANFSDPRATSIKLERLRTELLATQNESVGRLLEQQRSYQEWLEHHGMRAEIASFNTLSIFALQSASAFNTRLQADRVPVLSKLGIAVHQGALRVSFLILASWRLWCAVILLAGLGGFFAYGLHRGQDLLGQMGNGRMFFSGIKADLKRVTAGGAPDIQVIGLACPAAIPLAAVQTSTLGRLLHHAHAATRTNLALAAIILKHEEWPAYVPEQNEDQLFKSFFSGSSLPQNALHILEKALELRSFYVKAGESSEELKHLPPGQREHLKLPGDAVRSDRAPLPGLDPMLPLVQKPESAIDSVQYAQLVQQAFHRVLTADLRQELAAASAAELATVILAYEAGKVMAYQHGAGRWLRKSNFPQLCARAVLHSIPAYGEEYSFEARFSIRRALIYGSRKSAFTHVRFPIDLSARSRALRQLVEVLMACPHELEGVADAVELFAEMYELNDLWSRRFLDDLTVMKPDLLGRMYATPYGLFLMPVKNAVDLARAVAAPAALGRLHELATLVSQRQRLDALSMTSPDGEEKNVSFADRRVLPPFSENEVEQLARQHGLAPADVKDWGVLRIVLNSFSWLGRRVGDYTVPESSLIFVTVSPEEPHPKQNQLGLVGEVGIVPFRARRLEEKWGKSWRSRFVEVNRAMMAETPEEYELLLKGRERAVEAEAASAAGE